MRRTITRYNRILSAVLAFVLLFGALPMPAFSVESEQDPLAAEVTVETPHITLDGEQTDFMELRPYEKLDILVEGADEEANYQWQILHPKKDDMWINIYNANAQSIAVTLALVGNMLNDEDVTQLRCRMTVDGVQSHTDPITVQFLEEDTSIIVLEETVPVLETPEETEPATEATEAPAETEPVTEATEAPAETEPVTEATEAPVETEPATEATEAPVETEPVTEATEAPVETEPATEATEAPVETEPVTEATEAPVETEPVTEATEAPAETEPGMEALEPVEETQPVVLALEPVEETQPVVLALEPEPAAEEPQPVVTETEPLEVPAAAPTPAADVVVAPETVQASEENATLLAEGDEADSDFVTVTIEYMRYDIKWQDGKMVVDDQGEPVLEETGVQAFTPYIATLQKGTDLNTSVHNPSMVGYNTYLEDTACTEVVINETAITENKVYTVKYKPAEVNYSVRYYFQNIYDDLYAENTTLKPTVNGKGYTGATPPESQLRGDVPGFTALYYQPDSIAADGSTVFEVYYERNYYLMEFDCNGGYGAETLYNRYDSYVSVPTPVRPGYVFAGWDLVESEEPGFVHDEDAEGHLDKIPPYHTAYKAIWETSATTYTVVYWRENADDDGYSYWGSVQVGANADGTPDGTVKSNDHVSGTDHITATGLTEAAYFSYNAVKTELEESKRTDLGSDGKVIVEGDGSTVVNVYYSRNYYTINIRAQGKCQLHVHGTDCQKRLLCGQGDHVHSAECVKNLICDIPEHAAHTAACLRCEETEHPVHTDSCYNCGQEEHTHSAANGCTLSCTHVHSVKCYGGQNSADIESNYLSAIKNIGDANPESGYVYHISYSFFGTTNKYYLYYNNKWYEVNAGNISGSLLGSGEYSSRYGITYTAKKYLAKLSCEHSSHTDACYTCEKTVHTHSDTCGYKDEIHVHGASCYKDEIHIHTDACYSWTCGASAHTHTDACYGECIYPDHTHTNSCSSSSGTNTVKQVTRKYGADLSDIWPIVDGNGVRYDSGQRWKPSGSTTYSQVLVFIKNMPGDDFTLELDKSSNDTYTMHYYVEALNDSEATREYNGKKFKLAFDPVKANYNYITRDEDFFDIAGFTQWASNPTFGGNDQIDIDGGGNVYFYYERKVSTLKFHNINTTVQTVADLMYEYPLKDVTVAGNPASAYVPPYPSTYEPNAYEFGGWYTTPDCFDGTEVDWTAAKMPSTDMEIYAKWTPIVRTVTFYSAYSDIAKDEADDSKEYHFMKADNVPHGTNLGSTYYDIPEWPEDLDRETTGGAEADKYDFIGWFYLDEDNKKKFAPDSMEVIRDLVLFAEWSTSIDTTYEVKYVLKDAVTGEDIPDYPAGTVIADTDSGHASVGKTKTFTAKGLGDLYPHFRKKFFPTVNSHSILMEVQDEGQTQNKFEFEYVYDDAVYYMVRYVDAATQMALEDPKIVSTDEAVITEKFLPIRDYLPRSFYIRKALASDGAATENSVLPENVITFYYVRDTEHGSYSIEYYRENVDSQYDPKHADAAKPEYFSQYFTQYESIVGTEDLGKTVSAEVRTYQGYTHLPTLNTVITYRDKGDVNQTTIGEGLSGTIDYTGLTIKVYYTRDKYPYVVKYLESGTDKLLYEAERGEARFDADIKRTAPAQYEYDNETPGDASDDITYEYYLPNPTEADLTKKMTIREATSDAPNTMVFYYTQKKVEVQYHAVCQYENLPVGVEFGAVSINAESATAASGLAGSTATPADAFAFVGWFKDAECKEPVDDAWVQVSGASAHLKPKTLTQDDDWINHYYALFKPVPLNITYDEQGGADVPDGTALIGGTVTLPTTTRTDYTLTGWWYDANNDGKVDEGEEYAPGAAFTMPGKDVHFTAQWINSLIDNRHGVFVGLNMSFYKEGDQYYYKFPPGEPTVVSVEAARAYILSIDANGKNFWFVQEGGWDKALCKPGEPNIVGEPVDYINPAIMKQVTKNGDVIGVYDETGAKTKALLYFTEDDYKAIVKAWLNAREYFETHFASYNINWEKLPKDEDLYEAVPYVIKRHYHDLATRKRYDWFIDFVILPKNRFKVTYDLNLPAGFSDTAPVDPNLYGEGMYVNVEDFHDVPNAADSRYVAKFVGWTAADANGNPIEIDSQTQEFTMPGSDVTLTALWEFRAPLTISQAGMKDNESAIYHVTGNGVDLKVAITGNNTETIVDLPLGEYTVTEITGWTWKHNGADDTTVTITEPETAEQDPAKVTVALSESVSNVHFAFANKTSDWLHSESAAKENHFKQT